MKLHDHPDFEQAILNAAQVFADQGLRPAIIEKDYFVTEALRAIADHAGERVIFKGGTSLSKGWKLIDRFSEDIDLFLNPQAFTPALGKKGIDRELKKLRDAIDAFPPLRFEASESQTIGGFGRSDVFRYQSLFAAPGEVAPRVLLEAGTASGSEPVERVEIRSLLAEFLTQQGITLETENETVFPMLLLHFRRTFVEKMFAIHAKVSLLLERSQPLGSYARHYYDLARLLQRDEVLTMLRTEEYQQIKEDYDTISRHYFPRDYQPPTDLSFAESPALFPDEALQAELGQQYETQCRLLCFGQYPSWEEVLAGFQQVRSLL